VAACERACGRLLYPPTQKLKRAVKVQLPISTRLEADRKLATAFLASVVRFHFSQFVVQSLLSSF
jgi:hypothetical protein